MEVPWWAIVLFLFFAWNDAYSRSKAEASILPQFTKLHQNIESDCAQAASDRISNFETTSVLTRPISPQELISQQGVIHQESIDVQNPCRTLFICKANPGLAINQQQSADVRQDAISSTSASANIQRLLASNKQEQSPRLVCANPTVAAKKNTPKQESTKRTEIVTKAQIINPVVSNNAQQSSNSRTSLSEIRPFDGVQSSGPYRSASSSNSLNSNIDSVQTILSESNSLASVFPCAVSATPLAASDLRSPKAISPLSIIPIDSYSYPAANPISAKSQSINYVLPAVVLPEISAPVKYISSCDTPLFWLAALTNFPTSNCGENYINKPVAKYVFPIHSSPQKIVDSIKQSTAVSNIANEICYQPKVNPTSCNVQSQSLSSKSKVVQSGFDNYFLQSSAYSDVSSPVSCIYSIKPNPLAKESLYPCLDLVKNKDDVQTSVQTTQEITSRPFTESNPLAEESLYPCLDSVKNKVDVQNSVQTTQEITSRPFTESNPLAEESLYPCLDSVKNKVDVQTSVQTTQEITSKPFTESNPLAEESLYPCLDSVKNKVDVQTSVQTTQEITSRPFTESVDAVNSTISTAKDVIVQSTDVNIAPASFSSPVVTFVASVPSIPMSVTPVCTPVTPSVTPSFGGYPPIQPIIIEDSNSKTRNLLPVILASLIIDNGCSGYSGGYCTGSCNCGTQYSPVSCQTPINNNLNPYNGRRGSTCNCKTRDQSNSVIIIEVDSDNTENSDSSEDCDTDNSSDAQAADDSM